MAIQQKIPPFLHPATVRSIPNQWSATWFRQFLAYYLNPAALQNQQQNPVTLGWTLVGSATAFGTSVQKLGADLCSGGVPTPSAWDSSAYLPGPVQTVTLSFSVVPPNGTASAQCMVGLSSAPANGPGIAALNFGLDFSAGTVTCYEGGAQVASFPATSYLGTDTFTVKYDGTTASYFKNGTLLRSTTVAGLTLTPMVLLYDQGVTVTNITATEAPPASAFAPCPVYAPVTLNTLVSSGSAPQADWTVGQVLKLPNAISFNAQINGGVVDVLFQDKTAAFGNGYVMRLDGRAGYVPGQILKMTAGVWTNIGTAQAAVNAAALSGVYNVVCTFDSSGDMDIFVDGAPATTATDTTYSPSGATYLAAEVVAGAGVQPPTSTQALLDYVVDGVYAKVNATAVTNGNVDLAKTGVINKTLTNVSDGPSRSAVVNGAGMGGVSYWDSNNNPRVDFTGTYHIGKSLANIPDDATSARYAVLSVDANRRALIDFTQTGHVGKTIDNVGDGSQYSRTLKNVISGGTPKRLSVSTILALAPTHYWPADSVSQGSDLGSSPVSLTGYVFEAGQTASFGNASEVLVAGDAIKATSFNGWGALVQQPASTSFTAALWCWPPHGNSSGYSLPILGRANAAPLGSPTNYEAHLWIDTAGTLYAGCYDGGILILQGPVLNWAIPHHVALTVDSTNLLMSLYVDGQLAGSATMGAADQPGTENYWTIGCFYTSGWGGFTNGWHFSSTWLDVEDVAIWEGTVLDVNDIGALYKAGIGYQSADQLFDGYSFLRMPAPPSVSAQASTLLAQSGTTTTINVNAGTFYLGNITLNFNSGSVNPGSYGTWYVYFDDPGYGGGAVTFQASTNPLVTSQAPGRFYVGTITTASGGGGGGGSGGGGGCCLHESQMIELADGREIPARELTSDMILLSHEGPVAITELRFLPHREWYKVRLDNGVELFVAGDHRFLDDDFNQLRTWDLKLGQRVRARNGYAIVTGLDVLWEYGTKVAIEVAEPHTYYVQGILSHNKQLC